MNEENKDYLEIASQCIKWAEIQGTMKNYVAGLLKANEKKDKLLEQKENILKEIREYIEAKEKDDNNWVDYELLIEPIKIEEILNKGL